MFSKQCNINDLDGRNAKVVRCDGGRENGLDRWSVYTPHKLRQESRNLSLANSCILPLATTKTESTGRIRSRHHPEICSNFLLSELMMGS